MDPGLTSNQIEKELLRQATLFEEEVKRGTYLDAGKITFKEFIERWLWDYAIIHCALEHAVLWQLLLSNPADRVKPPKVPKKETKLKLGDAWQDENWVFTKWNGNLIHVDTVSSWFPEFIRKYNLSIKNNSEIPNDEKEKYLIREVNFHAIRHTAATLLINQGLNVKAVSTRLGHSNTSTTLNIYAHSLRSADKKAADMMEEIFTKKTTLTETKKA